MSDNDVKVIYEDEVVYIRLNRPKQRNALNENIRAQIASVLNDLMDRPEIRLLVLSGEGQSFCSGADLLTTSYPKVEGSWATRRNRTATWQRLLEQLDRIPQVTIASVHGHAIGGGALLATACDFRVVSKDVTLRIPEVAMGIPNVWNGTPLLAREVGLPTARDWVMTARKVDAEELLRCGWAQRCADDASEETRLLVQQLLDMPAASLALTRGMTSAMGRAAPGMQLGWADADIQQWTFNEEEYASSAREYFDKLYGSEK